MIIGTDELQTAFCYLLHVFECVVTTRVHIRILYIPVCELFLFYLRGVLLIKLISFARVISNCTGGRYG